ncbi:hypothetical protein JCM8097_003210 [Rhodosporidiobolus ruineniae]
MAAPLTSSPPSLPSSLPPSPPSPPSAALPHGALAPASTPSSASSSGSGRGRRMTQTRASSIQARRSAASLGLGVQYANMNELTSGSSSTSLSPSRGGGASSGSSPSPSPSRAYSPPSSRRSSLQFASPSLASAVPPSASPAFAAAQPPQTPGAPPGLAFSTSTPLSSVAEDASFDPTSGSSSRAPSRRPSLTHLASFLSGITHHTRVRSPGVHGGRGVSRSASRSQSRSRFGEGGFGRAGTGTGSGSGGESEGGEGSGGGDGGGEMSDADEEGSEFSFFGGGGFGAGGGSISRRGSRVRRNTGGGGGATSLSRASSVRSGRSRASSISISSARSGGSNGTTSTGAQHPLLHELVRENTTGGAVPSPPQPAAAEAPFLPPGLSGALGPNVVAGPTAHTGAAAAGTVRPETWEQTYEVYKPSVISTPRNLLPPSQYGGDPEEEPFLDSAPNSPEPAPRRIPGASLSRVGTYSSLARTSSALSSVTNDLSTVDVFDEGERVGVGVWLEGRGGWVRDCFAGRAEVEGKAPGNGLDGPRQLEVERRLGEGTYAIVYLVREVLYDPDPTDDDILSPIDPLASFEFGDSPSDPSSSPSNPSRPRLHSWSSDYYNPPPAQPTYGSYFALKCLCKKNLTDELIEVQRNEAFLHRALPKHENIVQMYGAYETDDWLFLVLEYAGGRDAFYWLLEAQEHGTEDLYSRAASPSGEYFDGAHGRRRSLSFEDDLDPDDSALSRTITADTPSHLLSSTASTTVAGKPSAAYSVEETPPSPSLLSAAVGDALLSRKRLRLISRMFGQMCAAVQACHDVGISHRDIKPENFIVIDGKGDSVAQETASKGVVVKITDWGLGTMEEVCEDFDCGSKPYMAYECRNNLRPTYDPRQADVWSLGLVFLNLLYHRNPWADPSLADPDFAEYVDDPVGFLQNRFEGMSDEVATFLSERVFCDVLEVVDGRQRRRVSAGEFGQWASRLVMMMGGEHQAGIIPGFSLHGASGVNGAPNGYPFPWSSRPGLAHLDSSASDLDFSPVATMPLSIGGPPGLNDDRLSGLSQLSPTPGAANLPPTASLLSQHFAPSSTYKAPNGFDDLPTVPEVPSRVPSRPAFISSPTALSEDGESLPSPTFPSPPPPAAPAGALFPPSPSGLTTSPERTFVRMPWSSPTLSSAAASPQGGSGTGTPLSSTSSPPAAPSPVLLPPPSSASGASSPASPAPPVASGISLLAARRPSLLDSAAGQGESMLSTTSAATVMLGGGSLPGSLPSSPPNGSVAPISIGTSPVDAVKVEEREPEREESPEAGDGEAKKEGSKDKSKRRKRGARKEKRAAKEQAKQQKEKEQGSAPVSPISNGRTSRLASVDEGGRDAVLDDLAAASQELARELSSARAKPTRPRPVPSSRSHGTQSTSALPFSVSSSSTTASFPSPPSSAPKKAPGMFGRLKTLVNEGNSDLEAFKRRVDERNASIGATSAPAKMQHGPKVPKGKYDSPFSSRGSVGTASWGSAADGGDESVPRGRGGGGSIGAGAAVDPKDHWSSASTRRDRLAGRREQGRPNGRESDFAPSSASTRGLSAFDSTTSGAPSRNATPLSSFGSVGSASVASDWRSGSHSRSRQHEAGLAPPLPVSPQQKPVRPKLKDAAIDTSDLGKPVVSPPPSSSATSKPSPSPALSPATLHPGAASAAGSSKASPRPLAAALPSASPVLAAANANASAPSPMSGGKGGNKLAGMLKSISVFNRTQPGAAGSSGGSSPGPASVNGGA